MYFFCFNFCIILFIKNSAFCVYLKEESKALVVVWFDSCSEMDIVLQRWLKRLKNANFRLNVLAFFRQENMKTQNGSLHDLNWVIIILQPTFNKLINMLNMQYSAIMNKRVTHDWSSCLINWFTFCVYLIVLILYSI